MTERVVRLASLSISNIKNVKKGTITFQGRWRRQFVFEDAEIVGIYGQNGSGKTAVIDALYHLKQIMMGEPLLEELAECIDVNAGQAEIAADFDILLKGRILEAGYKVVLRRTGNHVEILRESASCAINIEGSRTHKAVFADYKRDDEEAIFTPKIRLYEVAESGGGDTRELMAAKKEAERNNCSYIFGKEGRKIFCRDYSNNFRECSAAVKALFLFALKNLLIIRDSRCALISADAVLPMMYKKEKSVREMKENPAFPLLEPFVVDEENRYILDETLEQVNTVLSTVIPGMEIVVRSCGKPEDRQEEQGRWMEFASVRDHEWEIPLKMESGGIIKLISILNALIQAFGNPSVCLAVDELDTGIFGYLLDELLVVFKENAKGQLIFTSHNLTALKVLDRDNVMFSTLNPQNRYIRMKKAKETDNLYDIYMEAVASKAPEEVYRSKDRIIIAGEFRKAGRRIRNRMPGNGENSRSK